MENNKKTFWKFQRVKKGKIMFHIIAHTIMLYCWSRLILGWQDLDFHSPFLLDRIFSYGAVVILSAAPVIYWAMEYSNYKSYLKWK